MIVERLHAGHDRQGFRSGEAVLDAYLCRYALQNQDKHHIATTWVIPEDGRLLGFITLGLGSVHRSTIPIHRSRGLPDYPVPMLLVARLAVDERAHGRGVGTRLMRYAIDQALFLDNSLGLFALVVDAKPGALAFYERFGFEQLQGDEGWPRRLFLTVAEIRKAG